MEEILDYIEDTFPVPALLANNPLAEAATGDFFSKFCFYIKVRRNDVYLDHVESLFWGRLN